MKWEEPILEELTEWITKFLKIIQDHPSQFTEVRKPQSEIVSEWAYSFVSSVGSCDSFLGWWAGI